MTLPFFPLQRAVICDNIVIVFMKTNDQKNCSSQGRLSTTVLILKILLLLWKTVCHWSRVLFVLNYFPHRTLLKCEAFMDHTMTWFLLTSSCVCVKKTRFGRQMHQCFFLVFSHESYSIPNISMKIKWKLPSAVLPILSNIVKKQKNVQLSWQHWPLFLNS